jgi:mono/diheme cytochrome c family protein
MEVWMLKWMAIGLVMSTTALPLTAQDDVTLPDGAGKAIVQRMCVGCHSLKTVTSQHATKDQWSSTVQQMVSRGADGTDEEIATVVDYLAKNFPPLAKDKSEQSASSASSFEQAILPDLLPNASMLTMSQEKVDAMLRHWKQSSDRPESLRGQ